MVPIIIVGTGMAAYSLAREFRKLDKTTALTLISSDDGRSYPKPMLSNALSKGKTAEQVALFDAAAMAKTLNAEIIINSVVDQLNPQAHSLIMEDGSQHHYEKLVLAVGASPITIPIKGDAASQVLSINNLLDYTVFRERLLGAKHVALIGPGLIGCEFANDLIAAGNVRVSVIGPGAVPMDSVLPEEVAKELQQHLTDVGVEWHLGATTESISYAGDNFDLALSNGVVIKPDLVVSAVGLRANIKLASQAGLAVNRGVVTDAFLQTADNDIYALGDCAEVEGHNLLFVAPLLAAAKALAKTLAGEKTKVSYSAMPVAVKTPLYPLVIAPPARDALGEWFFENAESGFGIKGLFVGDDEVLLGFVLSGDCVKDKQTLAKQLPDILP
ncbi:MAG: FAD-dependent oxidoreductase [Methylophagaceae bacterium]